MLSWFRAMRQRSLLPPPRGPIAVPTLLLWGARDRFLGRELAQASIARCADGQLEFLDEATHWIQHEEADWVNSRLVARLR